MDYNVANYDRTRDDFYPSPAGVVAPLMAELPFLRKWRVWEPAAGDGALVDQLAAHGCDVIATDLIDYGRPDIEARVDFLMEHHPMGKNIVTNPPYNMADQFVRHGLTLGADNVVMLLRYLWPCAKSRADLIPHISHIIMLGRLDMRPMESRGTGGTGTVDFAWFVLSQNCVDYCKIVRGEIDDKESEGRDGRAVGQDGAGACSGQDQDEIRGNGSQGRQAGLFES